MWWQGCEVRHSAEGVWGVVNHVGMPSPSKTPHYNGKGGVIRVDIGAMDNLPSQSQWMNLLSRYCM